MSSSVPFLKFSLAVGLTSSLFVGVVTVPCRATAGMVNYRCDTAQAEGRSEDGPTLLQVQSGDLISSPKVLFGQPSYEPILNAKPNEFKAATPKPEITQSIGLQRLNQFAVASIERGNFWSRQSAEVYVSKNLLSSENTVGAVVVVTQTSSLVRSSGQPSVVVYKCDHLKD